MNIHWHISGVDLGLGTKEYGERRIHFALGRFAQRIARLDVYVTDENGPKGGVDKSCRVIARISVGTLAIGKAGAINAAMLVIAVLATTRPDLRTRLRRFREEQAEQVKNQELPAV